MKLSHFIGLLLVAVVALALGTGLLSQQQGQQSIEQQTFIDDFDFANVHYVILKDRNSEVELTKQLEQWQVKQEHGYKADTLRLSKLLQQFKDAKVQELKTSNSKNYHRLGLSEVSADNSESVQVILKSGETNIEVLLGSEAKSGFGQYAKFLSKAQTVLLDTSFTINTKPAAWLDESILDIDFDSVKELTWSSSQSSDFVIARAELTPTGELQEKNGQPVLPKGEAELEQEFSLQVPALETAPEYPSIFSGLVRNTVQLELERVLPLSDFAEKLLQAQFVITLTAMDKGLEQQTVLTFYQDQDDYWLTVNGRNWAYQISDFSLKQLSKPLSDYMQK